jgi:hypothetical protein
MATKPDVWYEVVGTVVGYLHQSEEDDPRAQPEWPEHDIMVILVESINGQWPEQEKPFSVYQLRWHGHDWVIYRDNVIDRAKLENGELIGLKIRFHTSMSEQRDYGSFTAVMRNNMRSQQGLQCAVCNRVHDPAVRCEDVK